MTHIIILTKKETRFTRVFKKLKNLKKEFHKKKAIKGITYYERPKKRIGGLETFL